jgi:hypothetical protein
VPYELSANQKKFRVDESRMLLDMLQWYKEYNFEGIAAGDKSWFRYSTYADSIFALSVEEAVPRTKHNISDRQTVIIIFFRSAELLMLIFLPKGTKFNQDYFIDAVLPEVCDEKTQIARRKCAPSFSIHTEN